MSEAEIRKYDPEDVELQALMGDKFQVGRFPDNGKKTVENSGYVGKFSQPRERPVSVESAEVSKDTTEGENVAENASHKSMFEFRNMVDCARPIGFGGLTALLFYWEHIGLMAESAAVPSMIVCAALFGFGIGKAVK